MEKVNSFGGLAGNKQSSYDGKRAGRIYLRPEQTGTASTWRAKERPFYGLYHGILNKEKRFSEK